MKLLKHLPTILLSASLLSLSTAHAAEENDIAVIINGNAIDHQTVNSYISMRAQQVQHRGAVSSEQHQLLLQEFINSELLYQAAIKAGIDKLAAVKSELETQRQAIIVNHSLRVHLDSTLTEAAIKEAYDNEYGQGGTEYHTRHILVESESEANNILAALKRGDDFKKLAAVSSIDPSSSDGGDLGWLGKEEMPATFAAVVTTLKAGEYGTTPAQSRFGWHIIQLDEKRTIAPPAIEQVTAALATALQKEIVTHYIEGLRNSASIEVK